MSEDLSAAVVVITTGNRAEELDRALDSIRKQGFPGIETVLVANGAPIEPMADVTLVQLEHNAGVPGGRNAGAAATTADIVFFLDDDAKYSGPGVVGDVMAAFAAADDLGVVSLRIVDEEGMTTRRHVPRLRADQPATSSEVTTFLGGACAIRRRLFDEIGPLPAW